MIIETQYLPSGKLLVSSVGPDGELKTDYFKWENPFKYAKCHKDDPERDLQYHDWEGNSVKKVYSSRVDRYSTYEFLDSLPDEETAELHKLYLPEPYFVDIEVEVVDGFPDPAIAPTMIQSMSIVHKDTILLYGLKPLSDIEIKNIENKTNDYFKDFGTEYKVTYKKFKDEFNMLYYFFHKKLPTMVCVTGWNFLDFDFRFLVNRAKKLTKTVDGTLYTINPKASSFTKRMNNIWKTDYYVPAHKLVLDYMLLYKSLDTSVKVKESNSLDFVSKEMLGVQKIKYNGSLMDLYEEDFEKFMFYNGVDSVLVQKIHEKGGYLNIILAIASLAKIQANDVYSYRNGALASLAITEGVLREDFRKDENIVFFKESKDEKDERLDSQKVLYTDGKPVPVFDKIEGGWVKDPAVGMNKWVACYDFASLYPTTQRQFFISPENFIGVSINKDDEYYRTAYGKPVKIDHDKDVIIKVVNKAVPKGDPGRFIYRAFKKRDSPTLKMLKRVYSERKIEKGKMMEKKFQVAELEKELEKLKNSL